MLRNRDAAITMVMRRSRRDWPTESVFPEVGDGWGGVGWGLRGAAQGGGVTYERVSLLVKGEAAVVYSSANICFVKEKKE